MNNAQILIILVLVFIFICALVAFLRTPREHRYKITQINQHANNPAYAPQYSIKERTVILLKVMAFMVPLFLASKYWFFPWYKLNVDVAHCYKFGSINGLHIIFYGLFMGFPLLTALILFIIEGIRSIKIIKIGQTPLPGQKVFKPTKYVYGMKAKLRSAAFLIFLLIVTLFGLYGYIPANKLLNGVDYTSLPACPIN